MACGCGDTKAILDPFSPSYSPVDDGSSSIGNGNGVTGKRFFCSKCFLFWVLIFVVAFSLGKRS